MDSGNNYDIYIPVHVSWILVGFDLKVFHFLKYRPVLSSRFRIFTRKLSKTLMRRMLDFSRSSFFFTVGNFL